MKTLFLSSLRSGLLTLGLVAGVTAPSLAGPILEPDLSVPSNLAAPGITPVRDEWAGGNDRQLNNQEWRWRNRDGRWRSGNFRERNFSRNWDGDNNWNGDDWRWRRHHHRRHFRDSDAAILGLGLGLGLGSLYYNNGYYNNGYYAQPRRIYRTQRLSSAHVQWCYDRYRSYRAWDNTFQPYNGPRQQCWSPYS
ncbi:BA14K family protein [Mesorhizobium sp. M4B.F.Ca.ET.215.01.1.1]|uniref:BA14K family protein n=1 Tax=unclassified Mesorhizobium TaxID=325217 RepID=UPI000FCB2980|nr:MULTISPECIES: BA14K family protein [unclassified Mesorhizobium]RUW19780.1 BA14K family protein [Mesorhizobium sp. M4B.F.Ca.ET.013.02.1.1]RVD39166.1 BA14K family protein [Mesorhizobium sp. M4B.F.Ca.ET.019.03.1.1]RWF65285.1 MAG: BA14K family protein [Mesorhizobium sp.]TGQ11131.1 BA14K family protein [Mesorhizobium sp. M4B.F.Ca.ET.215.01.1.1]TGQ38964.1 BA14K family protein [Mesorhizobium sp. M4B.F.Ca.ET.214.01.1.1]